MSQSTLLHAHNLTIKAPKTDELIVDSASFKVNAGEILSIIGPNGAGKSTLLGALAGDYAYTGSLKFFNFSPAPVQRARQIAALRQISVLNFPFSVAEVVHLGRIPHASGHAIDRQVVNQALQCMGIAFLADRIYPSLSGGEKQRVQLARVLAQIWPDEGPDCARLLLLDEPTAALDLGHQALLVDALKGIAAKGVGIITVLHDINLAARIADSVLAIQCSQVVASGQVEDVITQANMEHLFATRLRVGSDPETHKPIVTPR